MKQQKYIKQSEFNKHVDCMVCNICGNRKGEQHCAVAHCIENSRSQFNPNPTVSIYCNCPRCLVVV